MKRAIGAGGSVGAVFVTLWHFGIANIAEIQAVVIPLAYRLAPHVEWLNEQLLQRLAVAVTLMFVIVTLGKIVADGVRRFR
jgi:hypothetical protein